MLPVALLKKRKYVIVVITTYFFLLFQYVIDTYLREAFYEDNKNCIL